MRGEGGLGGSGVEEDEGDQEKPENRGFRVEDHDGICGGSKGEKLMPSVEMDTSAVQGRSSMTANHVFTCCVVREDLLDESRLTEAK